MCWSELWVRDGWSVCYELDEGETDVVVLSISAVGGWNVVSLMDSVVLASE